MNKKYKSEAFAAIHETAEGMYRTETIDKKTMRYFDKACLAEIPDMKPEEIRSLREREQVSQPIFAVYLNVSKNLVSDWERGIKKPGGPALRLLNIIQKQGLKALVG